LGTSALSNFNLLLSIQKCELTDLNLSGMQLVYNSPDYSNDLNVALLDGQRPVDITFDPEAYRLKELEAARREAETPEEVKKVPKKKSDDEKPNPSKKEPEKEKKVDSEKPTKKNIVFRDVYCQKALPEIVIVEQ
jgi:hypothetical protein